MTVGIVCASPSTKPERKRERERERERERDWLLQALAQGTKLEGEAERTPSTFEPPQQKKSSVCVGVRVCACAVLL